MATKTKKSAKPTKTKPSARKNTSSLLSEYNLQFANITNLLLVGLGAIGAIVDIIFETWNDKIGKNASHSKIPLVINWQTDPKVQGKYAEIFATFPEAEYQLPAYCFGNNTKEDVRRLNTIMAQINPPLIVLSLENIFNCSKFCDVENLLLSVYEITKQLQRNVRLPFCISSPIVHLPSEFYDWADAIFDCEIVGDQSRFKITNITDEAK